MASCQPAMAVVMLRHRQLLKVNGIHTARWPIRSLITINKRSRVLDSV